MKLNIGSGFRKMDGYVNVDSFPDCEPDILHNLEETPWPFETGSVNEIVAIHVLEHLGQETQLFFNIIKEIYRVLEHGGTFKAEVPHYMHPTFYSDPTHVRAFTGHTFEMLDRAKNEDWMARNVNATMLAVMLDVDFETIEAFQTYDERWLAKRNRGEITQDELREAAAERWGVVRSMTVTMRARKS